MKLNKRNCDIRIRLIPCGSDYQKVQLYIGEAHHVFWPCAVTGGQFSAFLEAVYVLYSDEGYSHKYGVRVIPPNHGRQPEPCHRAITSFSWDERGRTETIRLVRRYSDPSRCVPDPLDRLEIEIYISGKVFRYHVDGRDLCYALAKACTETLKKYGFLGYTCSSGGRPKSIERIDLNELLFVKAYALDVLDVRKLKELWKDPAGWMLGMASSFEQEMELLLFDM